MIGKILTVLVSNNKTWVSKDLKRCLDDKKELFVMMILLLLESVKEL